MELFSSRLPHCIVCCSMDCVISCFDIFLTVIFFILLKLCNKEKIMNIYLLDKSLLLTQQHIIRSNEEDLTFVSFVFLLWKLEARQV